MSAVLGRTGITPDQLTGLGLVLALGAGVLTATGWLIAAAVLIGLCGLADLLDGPLAKATGSTSLRGAFFDSVADRLSDVFMLAGVAWYLVSSGQAHLAVLALGALAASMLPSYVRAKADTLGLSARGGLMERAERMIALGLGLFLQPFAPVLVPVLWLILVLSTLTTVQRFVNGWRQASAPVAAAPVAPVAAAVPGPSPVQAIPAPSPTGAAAEPVPAPVTDRWSQRHARNRARVIGLAPHPRPKRPAPSGWRDGLGAGWRVERSHWRGSARSGRAAGSARRQGWDSGGPSAQ